MATQSLKRSFKSVDLKPKENNAKHHTDQVTTEKLIVRRGQGFSISLTLRKPYKSDVRKLIFTASTGSSPDEKKGTKSVFGISDVVRCSDEAKAVWRAEINQKKPSRTNSVDITITPSADAPVGKYSLSMFDEKLGTLTVLFNPWCPDDSVYMENKDDRQEYVMNESGVIFKGCAEDSIFSSPWVYGQFEEDMVEICLCLLKVRPMHYKDLVEHESSYCNPIYVSRVVTAMINSDFNLGVLEGNWSAYYEGGVNPTHWSSSHTILKRWYDSNCYPVKYGQCWVFAAVMCSVMRLLGIPCRVVTNFDSAHDTNKNLIVNQYHMGFEATYRDPQDNVWSFHAWVEAWMKRPDLPPGNDGWQVLDPTPLDFSGGVFCCGPAPVKAILDGNIDLEYDVPFVFAEVNADCTHWLVKADGSKKMMRTDTSLVGQKISTKSVRSNKREDLTDKYKFKEGTDMERFVFKQASDLSMSMYAEADSTTTAYGESGGAMPSIITVEKTETPLKLPHISMKFKKMSKLVNGKDVKLNLVLNSEATEPRPLSIFISVIAKTYKGSAHCQLQTEVKEETLLPGKDLCIPVVVPFSRYSKPMLVYDVIKMSGVALDSSDKDSEIYLVEKNMVLEDPPIEIKVLSDDPEVKQPLFVEIAFTNPVCETLKYCTFTLSGAGLLKGDQGIRLPKVDPKKRVRVKLYFCPSKAGQTALVVNFNCSVFRDIKNAVPIYVKKQQCLKGTAQTCMGPKV